MTKIFFLCIVLPLLTGDCLAGTDIWPEETALRQRNPASTSGATESSSVPLPSKGSLKEVSREDLATPPSPEEDMSELFLSLEEAGSEDIVKDFMNSDFKDCRKKLVQLRTTKDPRAYYLLGMIDENNLDGIGGAGYFDMKSYTSAFANAEEGTPVYRLSSEAYKRCIDRADPSKK